jgi:hypothetical protein
MNVEQLRDPQTASAAVGSCCSARPLRRRRRSSCGVGHLHDIAIDGEAAGELCWGECLEVSRPGQPDVQRLGRLAARSSSGGRRYRGFGRTRPVRAAGHRGRGRAHRAALHLPWSAVAGARRARRTSVWHARPPARGARDMPDRASARPRSKKAAAAARPPRPCARSAERSSSAATSSSGPATACARCQARRSGSSSGSVTSASARCTL